MVGGRSDGSTSAGAFFTGRFAGNVSSSLGLATGRGAGAGFTGGAGALGGAAAGGALALAGAAARPPGAVETKFTV